MRLLGAAVSIALVAALALAAAPRAAATASGDGLAAGDRLVYVVTTELQQHQVRGGPKDEDKVLESSAQGTATFTIYSIGADGTAYANVALDFTGLDEGKPVELQSVTTGKILPDGQLRTKTQVGLGVSDAIGSANVAAREIAKQGALFLGRSWSVSTKTPFIVSSMTRKVVGRMKYQGYPAYALQSTGSGTLLKTADGRPASGTISASGTTYYDSQDRLLIGEAARSLTVVQQPGTPSAHDDYSASYNLELDAWRHASSSPVPAEQSETAEPSPESSPSAASPQAVPSAYVPTPYPTYPTVVLGRGR